MTLGGSAAPNWALPPVTVGPRERWLVGPKPPADWVLSCPLSAQPWGPCPPDAALWTPLGPGEPCP